MIQWESYSSLQNIIIIHVKSTISLILRKSLFAVWIAIRLRLTDCDLIMAESLGDVCVYPINWITSIHPHTRDLCKWPFNRHLIRLYTIFSLFLNVIFSTTYLFNLYRRPWPLSLSLSTDWIGEIEREGRFTWTITRKNCVNDSLSPSDSRITWLIRLLNWLVPTSEGHRPHPWARCFHFRFFFLFLLSPSSSSSSLASVASLRFQFSSFTSSSSSSSSSSSTSLFHKQN